jgi:hypothetical protein
VTSAPWPPDDPGALDPLFVRMTSGSRLFRVHGGDLAAGELNPGVGLGGRFHFIQDAVGAPVPSLYGAFSESAALAETVFHDVPVRPSERRWLAAWKLEGLMLSELRTRRDLTLVELYHPGLGRLGLEPAELTATPPSQYPRTRAWAQALHRASEADGLVWMSRLHNTERVCAFFGDRVSEEGFEVVGIPLPLGYGRGFAMVIEQAEAAGITVVEG